MGTKRVGLARVEALLENLKREIKLGSGTHLVGEVAQGTSNVPVSLGCKKVQAFAGSLADTNAVAVAYQDNDALVYLGALDVSVPDGLNAASKILIDKVTIVVSTAAGEALAGNLALGTAASEATNGAITGGTEIFGLGAAMIGPDGLGSTTGFTEADIDFNTAGLTYARPCITLGVTKIHLYARTTTAINADITAGRFNVLVEYTVL
tara:strand:+ start:28 stop:651 length:624 start_codon:yes stop_codon:yes gene_type:complete